MRAVIVGLGNQGTKRKAVAGKDVVATVDPQVSHAQYEQIQQVPLDSFDAALVCVADAAKLSVLEYLLGNGKHVLVEKPLFATDKGDLAKLGALAAQNDVVCYTAYNHRFEPHIAELKTLLDSEQLGQVYLTKMFYGNGTARDTRGSWRDKGMAVVADLGSHLLDITLFLFGPDDRSFRAWTLNAFENFAYDHAHFGADGTPLIDMEITYLSWRNSFSIDVYAERGTAHIDGLCKWGPSTLTVRDRVLPSGKPDEDRRVLECADPTWAAEYRHFVQLCSVGGSNIANDIWINDALSAVTLQGGGA